MFVTDYHFILTISPFVIQCWCWSYWDIYCSGYSPGTNGTWKSYRCFWMCAEIKTSKDVDGTDQGIKYLLWILVQSSIFTQLANIPFSVFLHKVQFLWTIGPLVLILIDRYNDALLLHWHPFHFLYDHNLYPQSILAVLINETHLVNPIKAKLMRNSDLYQNSVSVFMCVFVMHVQIYESQCKQLDLIISEKAYPSINIQWCYVGSWLKSFCGN